MKVLKEEFNWVVRQKQRLEKALRKVQELACFNVLVEGDVADFNTLKGYVCDLALYIETKINKTLDYQDSRKTISLMERILADDVMRKRWKIKNENVYFKPYEAQDENNIHELIEGIDFEFIRRKTWPKLSRLNRKKQGRPVRPNQSCVFRESISVYFLKCGIRHIQGFDGPIDKADEFFLRLEEAAKMTNSVMVQTNLSVGFDPNEDNEPEKKTATIETIVNEKDDGTKVTDIIDENSEIC